MKEKIAFVVLHYKVFDVTKQCIDSILKLNKFDSKVSIIVVDNGSNNGSYEKIENLYKSKKNIYLIKSEENLGFANGNNLGFDFAKNRLKSDFIILSNNDIIFTQTDFIKQMLLEYKKYNYTILGPKIFLPKGDTFVYRNKLRTVQKEKFLLMTLYIRYFLALIHLHKIYFYFKNKRDKKYNEDNYATLNKVIMDVPVHGCCFCLSKNFIDNFDGLDKRTFLYCEEELLYLMIKSKKLISMYDPSLYIFHNHSSSTKSILKDLRSAEIFSVKNMIKSNRILLKTMKEVDFYEK